MKTGPARRTTTIATLALLAAVALMGCASFQSGASPAMSEAPAVPTRAAGASPAAAASAPAAPVDSAPTQAAAPAPTIAASTSAPEPEAPMPTAAPTSANSSAAAAATQAPAAPTAEPAPPAETSPTTAAIPGPVEIVEFAVPPGSRPHDVAPALDGGVWYTAQGAEALGWLDPATGETRHIPLGAGSRPHGVIVGPDGAAWITDGGLNAIVRVDPETDAVQHFPLPDDRGNANLNTATFDLNGVLWFTGQNGIYGRLDPAVGQVEVFDAPRGRGPYGITTTPGGAVFYASLAGSHIAAIDLETGIATPIDPPTAGQGARRVWSDSQGRIWVSEYDAGQVAVYDPATSTWREWPLPGDAPRAYSVYVDERDHVWLSDFGGSNALVRFDPVTETFESFTLPSSPANVRQMLGRPGEVWGAESGTDKLVLLRTG